MGVQRIPPTVALFAFASAIFLGTLVLIDYTDNNVLWSNKKFIRRKFQTIGHVPREGAVGSSLCSDSRLMPPGTFPSIALASFPGSGNTWIRHLIESATGIATGSVFNSRILQNGGFIGESEEPSAGTTLTVKTHSYRHRMSRAILIVRNPYRALLSEFNRRKAGKVSFAAEDAFSVPGWGTYVDDGIEHWLNLTKKFSKHCKSDVKSPCESLDIIYYDNLVENLETELRHLISLLPVQLNEERLACTLANSEGAFHRPKKKEATSPFTDEQRRTIDKYIKRFKRLIEDEKLPPPPESLSEYPFLE